MVLCGCPARVRGETRVASQHIAPPRGAAPYTTRSSRARGRQTALPGSGVCQPRAMSRRRSLCRGALHCSAGAASGGRLRRAALGAGGQQRRARGPGRQGGCRTKTPSEPRTVAVGAGTSRPSPPNRRWSWAARTVEGSGERQAPASWRGTVFPNLFPCFFFCFRPNF